MLELKSSYEPIQETPCLRSVSSKNASKPSGRSDSFNRILNKANQRSLNQKPALKTVSEYDPDTRPMENISAAPAQLDRAEKKADAAPGNFDQISLEETLSKTAQIDRSDQQAETNAGLINAMPQLPAAVLEDPDLSSSDSCEASTDSVASKIPTERQIEMPLNDTQLLTETPGIQVNDAPSLNASITSEAEIGQEAAALTAGSAELKLNDQINGSVLEDINNDAGIKNATGSAEPNLLLNELKASEQTQAAIQTQTVDANSALMQLAQTETNLATTEQTVIADLIENQTETSSDLKPAHSSPESNTANGVLALIAQALEIVEPDQPTGRKALDQDLTKPISSADDGKATVNPEKDNKVSSPEDIRFKLIEKTLINSSHITSQDQPPTDIKKLMAAESQRLLAAKPVMEEASLTEAPLAKSQPETNPIATGLEKMIYTSIRTGLDSQTAVSQSTAQTVDQQDLIEQIVQKIELLNKAGNSEMKIQLKPEFLGKMIIKIAVEDGLITAKFITESQHVKHLLEANMGSLKQNLEAQGLKVDRTEVNVQLDNGGSFHGDDSGREQMWQEYAERNGYKNSSYQSAEGYADSTSTAFDSAEEAGTVSASPLIGDGKVDFMI